MTNFCIVVTGLPGSGKTTIGKKIAQGLEIAFLDKDDYLEALYEERGVGDTAWRQALSRESDLFFQHDAEQENSAVLVSHWRPRSLDTRSGTPTAWLAQSFERVIEICCECPAEEATNRFMNRQRHAGHLDRLKSYDETLSWMQAYEKHLPLNIGNTLTISTLGNQSIEGLINELK